VITRYYTCIECGVRLVRHTSERVCPTCRPDRARRQRRASEARIRERCKAGIIGNPMPGKARISPDGNPANPLNSPVERLKLAEQITLARVDWRDRVDD
jgi:uncharacterized Zn finger protein (UPF0148 family)